MLSLPLELIAEIYLSVAHSEDITPLCLGMASLSTEHIACSFLILKNKNPIKDKT